MVWLTVLGIFNMCRYVDSCDAHGGCMDTVGQSALEVDSGRKIPCCTGDSNPHQYCAWLFSLTLYQLSYSHTPPFFFMCRLCLVVYAKEVQYFFASNLNSQRHSHAGWLFIHEEQKVVGLWCVWCFSHTKRPCLRRTSLNQTAGHKNGCTPWSYFHTFQTLIFGQRQWKIKWKTAVCFWLLLSFLP